MKTIRKRIRVDRALAESRLPSHYDVQYLSAIVVYSDVFTGF